MKKRNIKYWVILTLTYTILMFLDNFLFKERANKTLDFMIAFAVAIGNLITDKD